jgi:hypothetical protein
MGEQKQGKTECEKKHGTRPPEWNEAAQIPPSRTGIRLKVMKTPDYSKLRLIPPAKGHGVHMTED